MNGPTPAVCVACKKLIPKNEDSYRDMRGVHACKRCYIAPVATALAVPRENGS